MFTYFSSQKEKYFNQVVDDVFSLINEGKHYESRDIAKKALTKLETEKWNNASYGVIKSKLLYICGISLFANSSINNIESLSEAGSYLEQAQNLLAGNNIASSLYMHVILARADILLILAKSNHNLNNYVEKAHNLLKSLDNFPEAASRNDPKIHQSVLQRLGACHALTSGQNARYSIDKAIAYYSESREICRDHNLNSEFFDSTFELAKCYTKRISDYVNGIDPEWGMTYCQELLCVLPNGDRKIGLSSLELAILYLHSLDNRAYSRNGYKAAIEMLVAAQHTIDSDRQPLEWAKAIAYLAKAALSFDEYGELLESLNLKTSTFREYLRKSIDVLQKNHDLIKLYEAICLEEKMTIKSAPPSNSFYLAVNSIFVKAREKPHLNDLSARIQIEQSRLLNPPEAIAELESALSLMQDGSHKLRKVEALILTGLNKSEISASDESISNFNDAIAEMKSLMAIASRDCIRFIKRDIALTDLEIMHMASILLQKEETVSALSSLELFRLHSLSPDLESLLCIELQVDRKRWMFQHKQAEKEKILFYETNLNTVELPNNLEQSIALNMTLMEESRHKLIRIDQHRNNVEELIKNTPASSEGYFREYFKNHINPTASWILVPIIENHKDVRLVLLPPNSTENDIKVSGSVSDAYKTAEAIFSEGNESWSEAFLKYGSKKSILAKNIHDLKARHELETLDITLEHSTNAMESYLWEVVGQWVISSCGIDLSAPSKDSQSLVIVSHGLFAMFPFCIARDPNSEDLTCLLDYLDVSYVPSLYCLYSLHQRLKFWKGKPRFIYASKYDQRDAPNEKDGLAAISLEKELSFSSFKEKGFDANYCKLDVMAVLNGVSQASHWHLSTHGNFDWSSFNQSFIQFSSKGPTPPGRNITTPEILSSFETKSFFRLVVLAACETGMSQVAEKELAPESFLTEMLKSGAIGAIGSLWVAQEEATALIFGRFYHFHIVKGDMPSVALQKAQLWLRNQTEASLHRFLKEELTCDAEDNLKSATEVYLSKLDSNDNISQPFAHPWFWASFVLIGQ